MSKLLAGGILTAGLITAQACGPDFPLMLTTCRSKCLEEIKAPGFYFDVKRLGAAPPIALTTTKPSAAYDSGLTSRALEAQDPEPDASQVMKAMREAPSGKAAYAAGQDLTMAKRLYTAGAVDFNRAHRSLAWGEFAEIPTPDGEAIDSALTAAIEWFDRVSRLSPSESEPRLVWATYMLARSHELRGRPSDETSAIAHYRRTIELVNSGHSDPLDLADASLGALGRIALAKKTYAEAIAYYSEQVRTSHSQHAVESLWRAARAIPSDDASLERAVTDPVVQRLLIAYALSRSSHTCMTASHSECGDQIAGYAYRSDPSPASIVNAISHLAPNDVQWPDEAAAIAYAVGNFDLASRLVSMNDTPYAEWIRAKLALHEGNLNAAARAFAKASKEFAVSEGNTNADSVDEVAARMHAENGIFALSRTDYKEALYQLTIAKGFELDASYVAERVLTVNELKALVDRESWAAPYRDLLARRLARVSRINGSVSYYGMPVTRALAANYAEQVHNTVAAHRKSDRAAAWYAIARLDVISGMELRGSEGCPDFSQESGAFGAACGTMEEVSGDYTTDNEIQRVVDSAINPDRRFHYRAIAVGHLFAAADLLPRHSEALTSVLCNGVSWLQQHGRSDNEDLIRLVYSRYLKDGRSASWTSDFGSSCPAPLF